MHKKRMRCFIGFFGLTRSMHYTAEAIRTGFYEPLEAAGIDTLRAGHFNLPSVIDNPRSGEFVVVPDRAESLARPRPMLDRAAEEHHNRHRVQRSGPSQTCSAISIVVSPTCVISCTVLNACGPCWTYSEWLRPTSYLLLRPDLLYLDMFNPVTHLARLIDGDADLIVPGWQSWGGLQPIHSRFVPDGVPGAECTRMRMFIDACAGNARYARRAFSQRCSSKPRSAGRPDRFACGTDTLERPGAGK